jgi:toxin HigB-1
MPIRTFRHKGLAELWSSEATAKIDKRLHAALIAKLDLLDAAGQPEDLNLPGFRFHALHVGRKEATRYSVRVTGNYRLTFTFGDGDAFDIDFEDYH